MEIVTTEAKNKKRWLFFFLINFILVSCMEEEQQREGVEKKRTERLKIKSLTYNENVVLGKGFSWVAACCKNKTPRTDLALVR